MQEAEEHAREMQQSIADKEALNRRVGAELQKARQVIAELEKTEPLAAVVQLKHELLESVEEGSELRQENTELREELDQVLEKESHL